MWWFGKEVLVESRGPRSDRRRIRREQNKWSWKGNMAGRQLSLFMYFYFLRRICVSWREESGKEMKFALAEWRRASLLE